MIRNILSTFFTRFSVAIVNLVIAILLSNQLGASGRGEQSLIITLITFIIIVTSLIGSSTISYLIPRNPFSVLIIPSYLWVILIILVCFLVLPYLDLIQANYVTDVCILSLLLSVLNINISVLISHQKINKANFLNLIQTLIIVLVLVITFTFLHRRNINSYIVALYSGYGISLLISFFFIGEYFRNFRLEPLKAWKTAVSKMAALGLYNQIALFTQLLSFRLSYYMLNSYVGEEEVGIYSNAVSVAESIWLIGRSIGMVQHSKIVNSNDVNYSLSLTSQLNRLNLAVSVALITVLACIPESWYIFIFGDEFVNINRIIWTLGPGIVFFGVVLVLGYYFSSTGKHYVNAIASAAGLIMTIIIGFAVIPAYSTYGAGITASISYGITALIVFLFYLHEKRSLRAKF